MPSSDFFKAARVLGSSPALVQGGGGNISEKRGDIMFVKASGIRLREMAPRRGYASLNHRPLAAYLLREARKPLRKRSHPAEARLNSMIDRTVVSAKSFGSPSMEAGMHAVLPSRYVFHTHSALANVLGCMKGGAKIVRELFGDRAAVMPYMNPGRELAVAIARLHAGRRAKPILILANHGLLAHGDDFRRTLGLVFGMEKTITAFLRAKGAYAPFRVQAVRADFSNHFIPDSAVYAHVDFAHLPPEKRTVVHEMGTLANYVSRAIEALGAEPRYLSVADARFIVGMEKEKKRMAIAKRV